jgi:hypothetical protein
MNLPAPTDEERLMEYVRAAELEMENARRALSEAHQAYSLAKRKLKKAQAAYFASRAYSDLLSGNHERDMGGHGR